MANLSKNELNKRALQAGILFTICQFFVRGLSFLVTPLYTRLLTQEQYGTVKIFESWLLILVPVVTLGLYRSVEVAKHDYEERYHSYVRNTVILGAFLCGGFAVFCGIFYKLVCSLLDMTVWMMVFMLLYIFAEFAIMCFYRREKQLLRSKYITIVTMIFIVLSTSSSVGLLLYGHYHGQTERMLFYRIAGYYTPYAICGFVIALMLVIQGKPQNKAKDWKYGITFSVPLIAELLSIQIMNQIDKIMINKMIGATEAGIYSLATTISYILWVIEDSVWSAWQPWLYEKITRKEEADIQPNWNKMMVAFGMVTAVTVLVTPELILILGGKKYAAAVYIVMPLILSTLYRFYSYSFSAMENYYKKTKYVAAATLIVMVVNIILNYVGIRCFGYIAAAYATAISYFILMIVQAIFERKVTGRVVIEVKGTMLIAFLTFAICLALMWFYGRSFIIRYLLAIFLGVAYLWFNRSWLLGLFEKKKKH